MGLNLKDIESKLNSFTDKLNNIGEQVSDAINKGTTSFDGALNSCVNGIENKVDGYVQKKEQEKLNKVEKEVVEPTVQAEPIPQPIPQAEPIPQPIFNGTEHVEGVSFDNTVKPNIGVNLEKSDVDGSCVNQSILDKGVNLEKK